VTYCTLPKIALCLLLYCAQYCTMPNTVLYCSVQNLPDSPGSTRVLRVAGPVAGILYKHGIAFYHTMIEMIPAFLYLGPSLRQNPSMAVAMTCSQVRSKYCTVLYTLYCTKYYTLYCTHLILFHTLHLVLSCTIHFVRCLAEGVYSSLAYHMVGVPLSRHERGVHRQERPAAHPGAHPGEGQSQVTSHHVTSRQSPVTNHYSPVTSHQSPVTSHQSPVASHQSQGTSH